MPVANEKNTISGFVEEIVFRNDDNGFTVMVVDCDGVFWHAKGIMPYAREGERVLLTGRFTEHPVYGLQFDVRQCETALPTTQSDLVRYLGSGLIRGIGPAMAEKLVEAFGEETFDVLSYQPERLLSIPGIGRKKLEDIVLSYREQFESRDVILQLQKLGLTAQMSLKVYRLLGPEAVAMIRQNPYQLAELVEGFGFRHADALARQMGLDPGSPERIRGGLHYVLTDSAGMGHTFVHSQELATRTSELLAVDQEQVLKVLGELILRGEFYLEAFSEPIEAHKEAVYLPMLHRAESLSARFIAEMTGAPTDEILVDPDEEIDRIESRLGIAFSDLQRQAVKAGIAEKIAVITGGPGTGKTTIINGLIRIFESAGKSVALAAPTGRAAKRMTEATDREAKTIHRLLEYAFSEDSDFLSFQRNEENPLEAEVIILDEASMIDIILMQHLAAAIKPSARLIMVGDADQLPSVGPGNVLRDIIESGCVPVIRLTEIFRQSERSMIAVNAHRINHGEYPLLNSRDKDFFLVSARQQEEITAVMVDLVKRRLPEYYGVDPIRDIQILTPVKNSKVGTKALNEALQSALNGASATPYKKIGERLFKVGDKVMQIKNNYSMKWVTDGAMEGEGVFNGDMGFVEAILDAERKMVIRFDEDKTATYEYTQLEEITHAYAVTIHKSQGSEYPIIVMPVTWFPPMLMSRNILYTAVTRAKKIVVLVGDEKYMKLMVDRTDVSRRSTALSWKICQQASVIRREAKKITLKA